MSIPSETGEDGQDYLALARRFKAATYRLSPREVERLSGIDHMTVREIREEARTGEILRGRTASMLRRMEDFVESRRASGQLTEREKARRYEIIAGIVGLGISSPGADAEGGQTGAVPPKTTTPPVGQVRGSELDALDVLEREEADRPKEGDKDRGQTGT